MSLNLNSYMRSHVARLTVNVKTNVRSAIPHIKPLLDEEVLERQRLWNEQRMAQAAHAQQSMMMAPPPAVVDPATGYPMDASGNYALPAALLAQYPALAQVNWSAPEMSGGGGGAGLPKKKPNEVCDSTGGPPYPQMGP